MTTVAGQLLIPLAGDLADPAQRGRVVGTIASGVLTGILVSRTISGLVADAFGWRAIYVLAAVVAIVLAVLLRRAIPELGTRAEVAYPQLILSVFRAIGTHRTVQVTLVISSSVFAVFTMFWTALTFLLSSDPYDFSTSSIGLVGLVGLAGAVAAQRVGRLHDRGLSVPVTGGSDRAPARLPGRRRDRCALDRRGAARRAAARRRRAGRERAQPDPAVLGRPGRAEPAQHRLRHLELHRRGDRLRAGVGAVERRGLDGGHDRCRGADRVRRDGLGRAPEPRARGRAGAGVTTVLSGPGGSRPRAHRGRRASARRRARSPRR
ncbi:MFS transporter [Curtobacterium flaccumfaciens]|nr:MFS transporter [Curtobacterium flaccumfaciens]